MNNIVDRLKNVEALKDVPEDQIHWLAKKGSVQNFPAGEYIFKKGDPIDKMFIVLDGSISMRIEQNGQFKEVNQILPGGISGLLPYSRATKATGSGIAETDLRVHILEKSDLKEMIHDHHELTTALVHIMASRIREFTTAQQQDDKMMALGKLSAGLAHELNNPASAVVRSSSELKKQHQLLPELLRKVLQLDISAESMKNVNDLYLNKSISQHNLTLNNRTQLEDTLTDWLDEHKIDNSVEVAEILADFNFNVEDLSFLKDNLSQANLQPILEWMTNSLFTNKLVNEIYNGSKRISDLVHAIKTYSHMDRSHGKDLIDIHEGINSTLTMLGHKLRNNKIEVIKQFSENLPKTKAYAGALNQVWTNLIDNAIDAMEEGGVLTIETFEENGNVRVNIIDNGSGIEEDIKSKIFDPFYTTKDIGKGTGLGLDIVQKIIKQQHNGSIKVNSEPGKTVFKVCLPKE